MVHLNFVSTKGTIQRQCQVPRISAGPDILQVILGSEGTLGVITEVVLSIMECRSKFERKLINEHAERNMGNSKLNPV